MGIVIGSCMAQESSSSSLTTNVNNNAVPGPLPVSTTTSTAVPAATAPLVTPLVFIPDLNQVRGHHMRRVIYGECAFGSRAVFRPSLAPSWWKRLSPMRATKVPFWHQMRSVDPFPPSFSTKGSRRIFSSNHPSDLRSLSIFPPTIEDAFV